MKIKQHREKSELLSLRILKLCIQLLLCRNKNFRLLLTALLWPISSSTLAQELVSVSEQETEELVPPLPSSIDSSDHISASESSINASVSAPTVAEEEFEFSDTATTEKLEAFSTDRGTQNSFSSVAELSSIETTTGLSSVLPAVYDENRFIIAMNDDKEPSASIPPESIPALPEPSKDSTVGQSVINPITGATTTVSALRIDPAGTPTAGSVAFVDTADGYSFLVKDVGEKLYSNELNPLEFTIASFNEENKTVQIEIEQNGEIRSATLSSQLTTAALNQEFAPEDTSGEDQSNIETRDNGIRLVNTGRGGRNGRDGALFVRPREGGDGQTGPQARLTNEISISTNNQIGIEVGSVGGNGGNGGDSYASFWKGRDGGNGGAGGAVELFNTDKGEISATGNDKHGIFAYSRSGRAGDGGTGFVAPGGGDGGRSSSGGTVDIDNAGSVTTVGDGAYGVYGLSVSNTGGSGGSQWGIVGKSGGGGRGGNGGKVEIVNQESGKIATSGRYAHGILAQSIGGTGGSSGTSGNLILSLQGENDAGGNGGEVQVANSGRITTDGSDARGIFAQSVGGGGGNGGSSGGLVALGGSGSRGGSGSAVSVENSQSGSIETKGERSDGIFAQSVGGSGGSGESAGGIVAIGGSGANAGSGGEVEVTNFGNIATSGDSARGIVVQSIGGGGGDGGSSGGFVSVGGNGNGGGRGSAVSVTQGGIIRTTGTSAPGAMAQSVGGGGGNGGSSGSVSAFAGVAVGGRGGAGGDGGNVDFKVQGQDINAASVVSTAGDRSIGLFAQSVGGGGGNGGGAVQLTGGFGIASSFAIGGQGGAGGLGGEVTLSKAGSGLSIIETAGSDSTGVLLQSVGGGGGNGGYAVAVAASGGPIAGSLSTAVGGDGGSGGQGGVVQVGEFDNQGKLLNTGFDGSIVTTGERSTGLLAQSVGGGGGNGGLSVSAAGSGSLLLSGSVAIGVGGDGAGGGDGGTVAVGTKGNITTEQEQSTGLMIQSIGGGGGNGGGSIAASFAGSGGGAGSLQVGIGGSSDSGGNGGLVTAVTEAGRIATAGQDSPGILVQSVGGGGGNGGYSITPGGAGAGTVAGSISLGLGGTGGSGGDGKSVKANLQSDVTTERENSGGVLVQSVGSGGGNGGYSVTVAGAGAGTGSGAVSIGLGGNGGSGGNGGNVDATSTGFISTRGNSSTGFNAQSIGGGGGNGAFNVSLAISGAGTGSGAVSVGLGGSGAEGGDGGDVTAQTSNEVQTSGDSSTGVLAQSVGGGGGNGSFNVSLTGSGAGTGSGSASVGIGGSGGKGGQGGATNLVVENDVRTSGESSSGIIAQSIGGGGGNGGVNIDASLSIAETTGALAVGIGGFGGDGGDGGGVTNEVTGAVNTIGNLSGGVTTQSIGGGGGNGGMNVSGAVTAAKTTGGSLVLGIGGLGGNGGTGGGATSRVIGDIATAGDQSHAALTQSVGGGGGNGAINIAGGVNLSKENSGTLGVGIGGFGGSGGNAGDVSSFVTTAAPNNQISTSGDDASAIIAQSIGGGGGNGGVNIAGAANLTGKSGTAVAIGVGGFAGNAGHSGNVRLNTTGNVVTKGNNSNGLLAQSIGGGGGNGGTNISGSVVIAVSEDDSASTTAASIGVGGFGGGGGNAGDVVVNHSGAIRALSTSATTTSAPSGSTNSAHGLVAQSIGGGGGGTGEINLKGGVAYVKEDDRDENSQALLIGIGGFGGAGGNSGNVIVDVAPSTGLGNSITASGNGRSAILGSSIGGGGGNGNITIGGVSDDDKTGLTSNAPLILGIGGLGGNGGTSGNVSITAEVDLFSTSENSDVVNSAGLFAQSIGGGGGNGGLNVIGEVEVTKETDAPSLIFGIGGFGGAGATSGDVKATHDGTIVTSGGWTHGIFAQSVAGGGGNGTLQVSQNASDDKDDATTQGVSNLTTSTPSKDSESKTGLNIVAGLGGHSGTGAEAGNVSVESNGVITTTGNHSRGIFAQSIGGGGGTGSVNVTSTFKENSSPISLGVGGFGSGGGNAGSAIVIRGRENNAAGEISTNGIGAHAIEVSSIGGGGGDAGIDIAANISKVSDDSDDNANPNGEQPRAQPQHSGIDSQVFANYDTALDRLNEEVSIDDQKSPDQTDESKEKTDSIFAAQIAVGGAAGEAGDGNEVRVDNHGDLVTNQDSSHGILAQSIGGGGGNTTVSLSVSRQEEEAKNKGLNLAIGGATGDGSSGSTVNVMHEGQIATQGHNSYGVLAQSIGGGGGNAILDTEYSKAGGSQIDITIGRRGGSGGSGGDVSLDSNGIVSTQGNGAPGLLAQSIGNGGGNSSSTSIAVSQAASKDVQARAASISLGLEGGEGGSAGNIQLNADGRVTTVGTDSHAVVAQSIGGGGGNAGDTTNSSDAPTSIISMSIGGDGGQGGTGGNIEVSSAASVSTINDRSIGILAQSVGGAGGNGSAVKSQAGDSNVSISIGGAGGTGMSSGEVKVENRGDVSTEGQDSHAILAQSIGGGGGNAGMVISKTENTETDQTLQITASVGGDGGDGGNAEDVAITNSGNIATSKRNAIGLFAQSIGGGGGNANQVLTESRSDKGASSQITIGIGGSGGVGHTAGDISVQNTSNVEGRRGQIVTEGDGSHGILAMSVGGGGGTGSVTQITNSSSNVDTENDKARSLTLAIGGEGGSGGEGGKVTVGNDSQIATSGSQAHGIFAQSVGGGGGSSSATTTEGKLSSNSAQLNIGGAGGTGMNSGEIELENSGAIATKGQNSHGILAQSVGGGGGDAGIVLSNVDTESAVESVQLNMSIGGNGGDGGHSQDIAIQNTGTIETSELESIGIFAQSIGGGGGNGSQISTDSGSSKDSVNQLAMSIGGDGGQGNVAGNVLVTNISNENEASGKIITHGDGSHGILATSIGGGGGTGRLIRTTNQPVTTENQTSTQSLVLGIGGNGGSGGEGGTVTVENRGAIVTNGLRAHGIIAQSIGGGGGNGSVTVSGSSTSNEKTEQSGEARTTSSIAVGGNGGNGNGGNDVLVSNSGDIVLSGDGSYGIYAQSVGGGGGDGGHSEKLELGSKDRDTSTSENLTSDDSNQNISRLALSVGGKGGSGGDSGNVLVKHDGSIISNGNNAYGIFAQSVSGGGGRVGSSVSDGGQTTEAQVVSALIGGRDGAVGQAGTVTVDTTGEVVMNGANSQAQFVQSVNGGGGDLELFLDMNPVALIQEQVGIDESSANASAKNLQGSINLGSAQGEGADGSNVQVTHVGNLKTTGSRSIASQTQSIGGGGGNAKSKIDIDSAAITDLSFSLGSKNTNNSSGGDIELNRQGDVNTVENQSQGTSVQSIGGGGGRLLVDVTTNSDLRPEFADNSRAVAQVNLGADPSFSNHGGALELDLTGNSQTEGERSPGMVLQSIGAGGGESHLSGLSQATIELGASDGSTGDGSEIQAINTGTIQTSGTLSHGAVIQSIGGGGGFVLTDLEPEAITLTPSADNSGSGGDIDFKQVGDVTVAGDRAFGIFAQSLGGGGGLVDDIFADSAGGNGASGSVSLSLDGNLTAEGNGSVGLFAQSRGAAGAETIAVELESDHTIKVSDSGTGVQLSGGSQNSFINRGGSVIAATAANRPDGLAVKGDVGDENVVNQATGMLYGNVDLGAGNNQLVNEAEAALYPGQQLQIGESPVSRLTNQGLISPGDEAVYTTEVIGHYEQTNSGQLALDLNFADDSIDQLNISQDASLEGLVSLDSTSVGLIKPGNRQLVFVEADGVITQEGLTLDVADSAIARYDIGSIQQTALLDLDVDFAGFGVLNENQTAFGNYLNRVQAAGSSPEMAPLIESLFELTDSSQLAAPYDSLSPEIYGVLQNNLQLTAQQFTNDLFTCRSGKNNRLSINEGQCFWVNGSFQRYDGERTDENFGFDTSISLLSAGAQWDLGNNWFLGVSAGASPQETTSTLSAKLEGLSTQAGLALKKSLGATSIGLGVVGGTGQFDAERSGLFPIEGQVTSSQDSKFFGSTLRISHDIPLQKSWYIRPMLDLGWTQVNYEGFSEKGAGALNLRVDGDSKAYTTLHPAIELGGTIQSGNVTIRPAVSFGYTRYLSDPSAEVSAKLVGAPAGVDDFTVSSLADRDIFDTAAGIEFLFQNKVSAKLGYWGQYSKNTTSHGAEFKLNLSF